MRPIFENRATSRRSRRRKSKSVGRHGRQRRKLQLEQLEDRRVLASDLQNQLFTLDVNNDGSLSSIDALLVINFLNSKLDIPTSPAGGYLDSNGDSHVSSID